MLLKASLLKADNVLLKSLVNTLSWPRGLCKITPPCAQGYIWVLETMSQKIFLTWPLGPQPICNRFLLLNFRVHLVQPGEYPQAKSVDLHTCCKATWMEAIEDIGLYVGEMLFAFHNMV